MLQRIFYKTIKRSFVVVFVLLLALSVSEAALAQVVWKIAPGRTSIQFKVKHLMLMEVKGKFRSYDGTVVTPSEGDFSNAQVEATIPVSSIHTGNSDRDEHLLQEVFFHAVKFPEMDFRSTKVLRLSDGSFQMQGELTIRGITRPITLAVEHIGQRKTKSGKLRSRFKAKGALNRYEYGLRWNDLTEAGEMLVSKEVEIVMDVALVKDSEKSTLASAK